MGWGPSLIIRNLDKQLKKSWGGGGIAPGSNAYAPYLQLLYTCIQRMHTVYCKCSYLVYQKVLAYTSCEESAITVRTVTRCPSDLSSWENAAKTMKCESIDNNCLQTIRSKGDHRFQYHCVINTWMNASLEVCAPNRTIFGKLYIQIK